MQIIEQQIIGKKGKEKCEDGIIVTDFFVAVIDGSTSKSKLGPLKNGNTGGQEAVQIVKRLVENLNPECEMAEFCQQATALTNEAYKVHYGEDIISRLADHPEDRFCCSVIIYSVYRNEIWMIGDCQGLIIDRRKQINKHITNNKPYEAELAEIRSRYLTKALNEGLTDEAGNSKVYTVDEIRQHDIGRDQIIPILLNAMKGENKEYAVVDGFEIPLDKCRLFGGFDKDSTEIVLATDGYPRLFPTLHESEVYLQKCLRDDPLFIRINKETKAWMLGSDNFDDRTYVRFTI